MFLPELTKASQVLAVYRLPILSIYGSTSLRSNGKRENAIIMFMYSSYIEPMDLAASS